MQEWDDLDGDGNPVRCRYCGMPVALCDCGQTCMNGHRHLSETDAIMCELAGPTTDPQPSTPPRRQRPDG